MNSADLALLNFRVRTLDPARPFARAVAVRQGVVIAVGDSDAVSEVCDSRTTKVDGKGAALVPGLVDTHQHAMTAPKYARGVDLTKVRSLEQLREALARERDRVGDDAWVLGWGLDYNAFAGGQFSNQAIDAAVHSQPCLLRSMDAHTGLATRAALEAAGIRGPVKFSDASRVVCHEGVPTGELDEHPAVALVEAVVPPLTPSETQAMLVDVLRECAQLGITCIHQMDGEAETFELARDMEEAGDLDIRLVIPIWHRPEDTPEQTEAQLRLRDQAGGLWRGGVVKLFADGVIDTGTGWLLAPDTNGGSITPFWPDPARYAEAVELFARRGFQCVTHATGDAGVRSALDAYLSAVPSPKGPHRIEHIETLDDADLARFAAQGVVASMQPLHMQWRKEDGSDWWTTVLGPERSARAFRCRELLDSEAIVCLGSDWPVASRDPRIGMAWARLRREPGSERPAFEPHQRMSALEALEGYTGMAARAVGEEGVAGRISEGCRADFTVFAEDPVTTEADALPDLPLVMTVVAGRVVWQST